jgi:hypothetical protein
MLTLVVAQKCTLITSLSEFISVCKQPTSSVVFRELYGRVLYERYERYDDSFARHYEHNDD